MLIKIIDIYGAKHYTTRAALDRSQDIQRRENRPVLFQLYAQNGKPLREKWLGCRDPKSVMMHPANVAEIIA